MQAKFIKAELQAVVVSAARVTCAAALAVLIGPVASLAESDTYLTAPSNAPSLTKDELTDLSGLSLTAKKADPTGVTGLTVAAPRVPKVSELTVTLPKCPPAKASPERDAEAPKLLSSYPARGSTVRQGIVILRLTFDRPMTCDGLLENYTGYPDPCPPPLTNPLFSRDRRTFLTVCTVGKGPGRTAASDWRSKYGSDFGSNGLQSYRVRLRNFVGLSGQLMQPSDLDFYVDTSSQPVMTMRDAMAQDRFLRDAQKAAEQARTTTVATAQALPPSSPEPAKTISAEAAAPATPVSPVIVQERESPAVLEKKARGFVESYAAPTVKLDQYARWFGPACVAVDGVITEQAAKFRTRVEQVARAVGAPVGPAKCEPNIEIAFTNKPQQYIDAIAASNPTVLGYGGDKTVTRPIQAWYATISLGQPPERGRELNSQGAIIDHQAATLGFAPGVERFKDRLGMTPTEHNFAEGRRCIDSRSPTCPHSGFLNVLVLVDAAHMGDVSVDLTADYLAMLALSQPQPRSLDGCMALPSVIDLYATACSNREPPTGLTPADMAYLKSLYTADLTVEKAKEQSEIAGRMVKILTPAKEPVH